METSATTYTVSIKEFCRMVGISRSKAFLIIRQREVSVVRLGRKTLITVESIEQLLERNMVGGNP